MLEKPKLGRPVLYTKETFDELCALAAEGWSLNSICKLDNMPHKRTFYKWIRQDMALNAQYARAKEDRADFYVDQLVDIADNIKVDENGHTITLTTERINEAKLRIDVRKWVACKLHPRNYGDQAGAPDPSKLKDVDVPNRQTEEEWLKKNEEE